MYVGRCAYSLRTISDIRPEPTFRGPVVINPLVSSIVLITAKDEISETKTPNTLSNTASNARDVEIEGSVTAFRDCYAPVEEEQHF
jgi:hypothetical protein